MSYFQINFSVWGIILTYIITYICSLSNKNWDSILCIYCVKIFTYEFVQQNNKKGNVNIKYVIRSIRLFKKYKKPLLNTHTIYIYMVSNYIMCSIYLIIQLILYMVISLTLLITLMPLIWFEKWQFLSLSNYVSHWVFYFMKIKYGLYGIIILWDYNSS